MKRAAIRMTPVLLVLLIVCQVCWADLTDGIYRNAQEAYARGDWATTAQLLGQYVQGDKRFLDTHKDIEAAISQVIKYCNSQLISQRLAIVSAESAKTPPALPKQ